MCFVLIPSPLTKLIEDVGTLLNSLFFNVHLLIYRVLVRYQYFCRNKSDSKLNICYDRNKYVKVGNKNFIQDHPKDLMGIVMILSSDFVYYSL